MLEALTTSELFAEVKRRKMFVSNLYEGTDGIWRCFLRKKKNAMSVLTGRGESERHALIDAMTFKIEDLI